MEPFVEGMLNDFQSQFGRLSVTILKTSKDRYSAQTARDMSEEKHKLCNYARRIPLSGMKDTL